MAGEESEVKERLRHTLQIRQKSIIIVEGYIKDLDEEIEMVGPRGKAEGEAIRAVLTWNLDRNRERLELGKKMLGRKEKPEGKEEETEVLSSA